MAVIESAQGSMCSSQKPGLGVPTAAAAACPQRTEVEDALLCGPAYHDQGQVHHMQVTLCTNPCNRQVKMRCLS